MVALQSSSPRTTSSNEASLTELQDAVGAQCRCFPAGCCVRAALAAERVLGLTYVEGLFLDDSGIGHPHAWNFDPDTGEYVDLTARQFNPQLPRILRVNADSEEAKRRYIEGPAVGY